ncbi:hypothetical protein CS063_16690 [Sporanaerobium hydrogeniformans]|uniref:Uncharacterized protein n=1 Tax=Sporanaerobium hydrogeniformans TaxID=3072179 RepID=A0AC61D7H8_9FIRM|nr:DUF4234 domain-containing protein [Sporanaerobium hydrogeniformans]PHV69267.1 hypothetical protein CS063_16690 [Sporanaerobium hydrogeniformans]
MKKRNLIVVFLLNIVTLGFYGLYWIITSMEGLNQLIGKKIFDVEFTKKMLISTVGAYAATFIGIGFIIYQALGKPGVFGSSLLIGLFIFCMMMVLWIVGMVILHIKFAAGLQKIQQELWIKEKLSVMLAGLMVIMFGATVPYMQSYINSLIDHKKL